MVYLIQLDLIFVIKLLFGNLKKISHLFNCNSYTIAFVALLIYGFEKCNIWFFKM